MSRVLSLIWDDLYLSFLSVPGIMWWSVITQPLQHFHCVLFWGIWFCFWLYIMWFLGQVVESWYLAHYTACEHHLLLAGLQKQDFWANWLTALLLLEKNPTLQPSFESDWRKDIEILCFLIWLLVDKYTYHTYLKGDSYSHRSLTQCPERDSSTLGV